jgi:hypothetical protein
MESLSIESDGLPACFMKEWRGMTISGLTLPGFVVIG